MLRAYKDRRFTAEQLARIGQANNIIVEYQKKGYSLTLRQLYYQHVARGLIVNNDHSYSRLGDLVSEGRMAGLISWEAIEDRTRSLRGYETYTGPAALLRDALSRYRRDMWQLQPWRPEVWVEKEALADVVGRVCSKLRVNYFACRGYVSQSEQWRAGRRLARYIQKGQRPIVFHLGDHDPSGIDMTRDNTDRLSTFAGYPIQVVRLALNMDQIRRYNPPPNPAKVTDSRFSEYQRQYGDESWELDALNPEVISDLIAGAVLGLRDARLWDEALAAEATDRQVLQDMIDEVGGVDNADGDDDE